MNPSIIEDIYPLSPMQRGMLFHSLLSAESGVYIEQTSCTFEGTFDVNAFKLAWENIVDRHSVLRTAFVWEDVDEPLQIVYKSVALPFKTFDWQDEADKKKKLEELLKSEVEEAFDLETAPLMKMVIVKADADTCYFVWTHHHILFDGWSAQIIIGEVFGAYYSLISKGSFSLKPVRPFRDYIAWLQTRDMHEAQDFWTDALKGLEVTTSLRFPAPRKKTGGYSWESVEINNEISAGVYAFCRKNKLTMNTLIQGLWALILAAYCDGDDVVFGSTVSGRPAELLNIDSTVGLFINTLPVRIRIQPEMNFVKWLESIQLQQARQRKYEYCSLTDIHGWSRIPRETPLFESIIVFENFPVSGALKGQNEIIKIRDVKSHSRTNYPLTVVIGASEKISIEMGYDESLFNEEDIHALFSHFNILLSNISLNAGNKLNEISLLSDEDEKRILSGFSQGDSRPLPYPTIQESFEAIASNYADLPACRKNGLEISYRDLKRKSDMLACMLRQNGLNTEDIVAVIADRSVEMAVGIMAILKSAGAFLPIDPNYPEDRILYMLEDSKARLILTQKHLQDKIPKGDWKIILLNSEEEIYSAGQMNPEIIIHPDNLAYVIYTSGSTGKPKGTMLSHKGVISLAQVQREAFNISPAKRILQFSSLSFDASVWEIFMALLNGASLYLCDRETTISGENLKDYLKNNCINVLTVPPSVLSFMPYDLLPDLEVLVTAGEAATWPLIEKWSKRRKYFNAYGPTEVTVCTTLHECSPMDMEDSNTPPIGRPISNLSTYILDRFMHPVPIGAPGELFIGGVGLARGYLGRPELTAEKFLPDPFSGIRGSRLYRTGDMARYLKDGNIEFLGRIDHQVKLRGFRIELQEIESQMRSYPGVKDAAVILSEDHPGSKRLIAYVVSEEDAPDTRGLQAYLKNKLPEYMVPQLIMSLEKMPLNTSGKIDRTTLLEMALGSAAQKKEYTAPKTHTEKTVTDIAAVLLKIEKAGIYDNFFELGGHSLMVSQFVSRIRESMGIEIPLRLIFEKPVFADLALEIELLQKGNDNQANETIKRVSRDSYRMLKSDLMK